MGGRGKIMGTIRSLRTALESYLRLSGRDQEVPTVADKEKIVPISRGYDVWENTKHCFANWVNAEISKNAGNPEVVAVLSRLGLKVPNVPSVRCFACWINDAIDENAGNPGVVAVLNMLGLKVLNILGTPDPKWSQELRKKFFS
jgi:hypothetical protein